VINKRVVGDDWQLSRICLTRCFAVLVERRVVGEMAIFANHHNQDGRYSLPHPLIRFIQTYPTYQLSGLVACNAQLLPSPSTSNPNPLSLLTPDQQPPTLNDSIIKVH